MLDVIELIGLCAGTCTTLSFIPQIKKVWRSKSAKDISLHMYIIYCSGVLLWTVYGILIGSISLIIANIVTLSLALSILVMKIRWQH